MSAAYERDKVDHFVAIARTKLRAFRGLQEVSAARRVQLAMRALEFLWLDRLTVEEMRVRGVPSMQTAIVGYWHCLTTWERATTLFELADDVRGLVQAMARDYASAARVEDGEGGGV